jgi:UPF0271 protein
LRATVRLARAHGVAIGAHPGFPDLAGFGRRELRVEPRQAEDFILYQVAAVAGVAAAEGGRLVHVKAHGALYNMAAGDRPLADALARATAAYNRALVLFVPAGSEMLHAARDLGLRVAIEAFADRAYERDGRLLPRQQPGALIVDETVVASRAVRMATEGTVVAVDGSIVRVDADTLCVHSDTPGADRLAAAVRSALEAAGVVVTAISS